ncbi:hypothetical protein Thiofri_03640 [Thiorhodovibrio frisius]|nr:hypothetical protein Thiofri_03640 [Thiorhodovibrio frisius]
MGDLNLVFGGDVMLVESPGRQLKAGGGLYAPELALALGEADLFFANLELPFSDNCLKSRKLTVQCRQSHC